MKPYHNDFLKLYDRFEDTAVDCGAVEAEASYRLVLEKAGLNGRRGNNRPRLVLLAAALVAVASVAAAAAWYSVSDAFRGTLEERGPDGTPCPISSVAPIVDRSGTLVNSTVKKSGVSVTLRAAIGDERSLRILMDIEDTAGNPLSLLQPDGSRSAEDFIFDSVALEIGDSRRAAGHIDERGRRRGNLGGYSFGSRMISGGKDQSKATLMLEFDIDEDSIRGETFRLTLYDLMQWGEQEGVLLDMAENDLYNIVSGYGAYMPEDFEVNGWTHHESGEVTEHYELIKDADRLMPLSGTVPGARVSNAVLWDGILYLRGTAANMKELDSFHQQYGLYHLPTGKYVGSDGGGEGNEDGAITWNARFPGFDSVEDLKGWVWMINQGEGIYPVISGTWEFEFTLDYDNTTIRKTVNRELVWDRHTFRLLTAEVSPYTFQMELTTTQEEMERIMPPVDWGTRRDSSDWEETSHSVTLELKDGTTMVVADAGGSYSYSEGGQGEIQLMFNFDVVIDPITVKRVRIGDLTVEMQS